MPRRIIYKKDKIPHNLIQRFNTIPSFIIMSIDTHNNINGNDVYSCNAGLIMTTIYRLLRPMLSSRDAEFYETVHREYPAYRFPRRLLSTLTTEDPLIQQKYILHDRRDFANWRRVQIIRLAESHWRSYCRQIEHDQIATVYQLNAEYRELYVSFWLEAPIMRPYQRKIWEQHRFPEFYRKNSVLLDLLTSQNADFPWHDLLFYPEFVLSHDICHTCPK